MLKNASPRKKGKIVSIYINFSFSPPRRRKLAPFSKNLVSNRVYIAMASSFLRLRFGLEAHTVSKKV